MTPKWLSCSAPTGIVGCKRLCVDTNYYATYNRDNVSLVDVSQHPVDRLTDKGIVTNNTEYEFDDIIFATGFDAMTGTLLKIDIQGQRRTDPAGKMGSRTPDLSRPLYLWLSEPVHHLGTRQPFRPLKHDSDH